jgi:hypothetical protein
MDIKAELNVLGPLGQFDCYTPSKVLRISPMFNGASKVSETIENSPLLFLMSRSLSQFDRVQ